MNQPWVPYLAEAFPASSSGTHLAEAFARLVEGRYELGRRELFDLMTSVEGEDGGLGLERCFIRDAARRVAEALMSGAIKSFARPVIGGPVQPMPAMMWEIDDPLPRFATGCFNWDAGFDSTAPLTHRIFVSTSDFQGFLASLPPVMDWEPAGGDESKGAETPLEAVKTGLTAPSPATASYPIRATYPSVADAPAESRYIGLKEVLALTGISRSTLYAKMEAGSFPSQCKVGPRMSRWWQHEVVAWQQAQPRARP